MGNLKRIKHWNVMEMIAGVRIVVGGWMQNNCLIDIDTTNLAAR